MKRRLWWCIGFNDLSFVSVHKKAIEMCLKFSCSTHIFTQFISIPFKSKIEFCENTWFSFSRSHMKNIPLKENYNTWVSHAIFSI